MNKKLLSVVAALAMTMSMISVHADEPIVSVYVNGEKLSLDVAPIMMDERTLVPIRAISEYLGYDVTWDEKEQSVSISNGIDTMLLHIGSNVYTFNGAQRTPLDVPALIKDGRTLVPARAVAENFGCDVEWDGDNYNVLINKYNIVEAANTEEMLNAVDSFTMIILTGTEYKLGDEMKLSNQHVVRTEVFDGYEYEIRDVKKLLIVSDAETGTAAIMAEPRYADVLSFMDCDTITLRNLTIGHTPDKGYCTGGVINTGNSKNIYITNCDLYGCGTYGLTGESSSGIFAENTKIHDCTYGCVDFSGCGNIYFHSCEFCGCEGFSMFGLADCIDVTFEKCSIHDNDSGDSFYPFIDAETADKVRFISCSFSGNTYPELYTGDVEFNGCTFE